MRVHPFSSTYPPQVVGWSLSQHILAMSPIMCVFVCVQACMCITDQASLYISIFQYLWDVVIHSRQSCGRTKHKHEFKAQKGACLFQNSLSSISVVTECLYSKSSVSDANMKKRYELHNRFMNSWHLKRLPAILCQQCQVCPLCFLCITLWFSHTALCCVHDTLWQCSPVCFSGDSLWTFWQTFNNNVNTTQQQELHVPTSFVLF